MLINLKFMEKTWLLMKEQLKYMVTLCYTKIWEHLTEKINVITEMLMCYMRKRKKKVYLGALESQKGSKSASLASNGTSLALTCLGQKRLSSTSA